MPANPLQIWDRLRSVIKECLTFAGIKDAAGRAGLLAKLAHLQQRQLPERGASKSELLDEIGIRLTAIGATGQIEAVTAFIQACLKKQPQLWAEIYPAVLNGGFDLSEDGELKEIGEPEFAIRDLARACGDPSRREPSSAACPPSVFISYSHADIDFQKELATHLKALSFAGNLTFWSDEDIKPGEKWFAKISSALDAATVAVLLVSSKFLASDFIREHELSPILRKHKAGTLKLLWVPIRACNWEDTEFEELQAVVSPSKPLAQMKAERDSAWVKICKAIKAAAGE